MNIKEKRRPGGIRHDEVKSKRNCNIRLKPPPEEEPYVSRVLEKRDWSSYNKSQESEKQMLYEILLELVNRIDVKDSKSVGRKGFDVRDKVFCMAVKIYCNTSLRRLLSELRNLCKQGYIERAPSFGTLSSFFNDPQLEYILKELVFMASLPLKSIEFDFCVDSSGFSSNMYVPWSNIRCNTEMHHDWVKSHIVCGRNTNIVTSIDVSRGTCADSPFFESLVRKTAEGFEVREVSADKAYSSHNNLNAVDEVGGIPYIPFKSNARGKQRGSSMWSLMFWFFHNRKNEFRYHYHKRSNVESTFFIVKRKFGDCLHMRNFQAQKNEVLTTFLVHNLCTLVKEFFLLEIPLDFRTELSIVQ